MPDQDEQDIDTQVHRPFWRDDEGPTVVRGKVPEEETEIILPPMYREESTEVMAPPPGHYEKPTRPPIILPPPPVARRPPSPHPVPMDARSSGFNRARAGFSAGILAALLLGVFIGYLLFTWTAASQFADNPPKVQVLTKTATTTSTATAIKTKTMTETAYPDPVEVTRSATATTKQTVIRPQPRANKTVFRSQTPQSCLNALDAADQYQSINRHGRGNNEIARQARANFQYWSRQCQKESG